MLTGRADEDAKPFVSVIIPVYRNPSGLRCCLEALHRQSYPPERYEIIVVQDESDDTETAAVCLAFPDVKYLEQENRGSYAARNRGLSAAAGTVIAFTDSDCIPTQDWITAGVRALASSDKAGLVGGHIEFFFGDPNAPTAFELYDSIIFLQQEKLITRSKFGATANLFTCRSVFDDIGTFVETVRSGGDGEWGNRAASRGYALVYARDAVVLHPARRTFQESYSKWIRVVRGMQELRGKSGYRWAHGRSALLQWIWPRLGEKRRLIFGDPRMGGFSMKLKVYGVAILRHYLSELARVRYRGA